MKVRPSKLVARSASLLVRALAVFALLAAVPAATPVATDAQITPSDSAAVLLRAATDFERQGRWDVAEAIYRLILEQYGGTPAAAEARTRLDAPAGQRVESLSTVELPVFGTLYGLFLGVTVPVALGSTTSESYGAGLLIGGPLGLFASRAALKARPMTEGQVRAISWGGIWGTWQGGGWAGVFDLGTDEICDSFGCYDSGNNEEEIAASMIVGGLAGIAAGAVISRNPIRSGTSSGAQGGSTWGSIYGALAAEILTDDREDTVLASALLAGNAGLVAGALLASRFDVSRPRIRMINLGALVGGLGGVGIDLLTNPDDDEVALTIPLLTSIAGLGIATYATRNSDRGERGEAPDVDMALLGYRDGRLSLGTPMPMPTLLPVDDATGRPAWRPALSFELFRARF